MADDLIARHWDVIVIGTGIGGGTAGRRLAERGLSVLFVEKGSAGHRAEQTALNLEMVDPVARQIRGFWPSQMKAQVNGRETTFFAPLGSAVGGSSVFYAATLERPERHDLDDCAARPHPTGGWPVSYDNFRPYFEQAEQMYHICGEVDPLSDEASANLRTPPPLSAGDVSMKERLAARGLHPYRLHSAVRYVEGCRECFGAKCPRDCKMDGRSAGVDPALATGKAALLDRCEVRALRGRSGRVTHIEAMRNGKPITLRGTCVVLAAGALSSPRVLLASKAKHWPDGCGNDSGLVGRNLMFHMNEMIAVWPTKAAPSGPSKSLGFRDLYYVAGQRFGMVQAMGIDVSYGEIVHYLKLLIARSPLRRIKPLQELVRIPAIVAARLFGSAKVFVGLMEDLPYAGNRVVLSEGYTDTIRIEYQFSAEVLARRRVFRRLIRRAFAGHRRMFLGFQPELNFGHPCGTLRFGHDPAQSVLTPDCRAHEVENLYVTDASIFPTSFGVNPSLMIAANALRVADLIADEAERRRDGTV
ncbi:GMC oxidoreductase [Thalassovita taeanensis]|uniref:Choline dehydrogenase n=1 Tax=Thalassovita taeanensis TaxID=657014 RepID=A0A1H9C1V1_9RHOB|nr:GMC family oxidoreductase [Thalassovita taeanensis]SEP94793.1 Choline dehydrogenase [Thalassovita taeanensis]